jgi:hypothetical protein
MVVHGAREETDHAWTHEVERGLHGQHCPARIAGGADQERAAEIRRGG